MTATPLAMVHHHHGLDQASLVIQLHVLGMFLPSFFTGSLIARFGVLQVMGVAPRGRGRATRPTAAAIPRVEGSADPRWYEPVGAADVEG